MVLIWLLPGLPPLANLEEPQQAISRRLVPGYVCLCHHSQCLLRFGDLDTCILLGCGALQRPLDPGQPWHCLPRPCHLHTGASLSHFSYDFSLLDWISDTLSQGYANLQSLVKCLDHTGIVSDTVCSPYDFGITVCSFCSC